MTKLGTKWVRNDQTGYEMTKLKIKVGTKWPKWYEMTKMVRNDLGTKWPGYEMTDYQTDKQQWVIQYYGEKGKYVERK